MILIQHENHGVETGISYKLPKMILIGRSIISYLRELYLPAESSDKQAEGVGRMR